MRRRTSVITVASDSVYQTIIMPVSSWLCCFVVSCSAGKGCAVGQSSPRNNHPGPTADRIGRGW